MKIIIIKIQGGDFFVVVALDFYFNNHKGKEHEAADVDPRANVCN